MHPDLIEEMEYACFARSDYLREAFGPTAEDACRFSEEEAYWDHERECDVRDIPTVVESRFDPHVVLCVSYLLGAFDLDDIPF